MAPTANTHADLSRLLRLEKKREGWFPAPFRVSYEEGYSVPFLGGVHTYTSHMITDRSRPNLSREKDLVYFSALVILFEVLILFEVVQ